VPRSIAAVPLIARDVPIGVLQVLDKRTSTTFSLRDIELMSEFARLAAAAIEAGRVQRDIVRLLGSALGELAAGAADRDVESVVAAATSALDRDDATPFWRLVDRLARLPGLDERDLSIVSDILDVLGRHALTTRRSGVRDRG
jgi:hypothetical protein